MAFAQLTCRESLRDVESCLRAQQARLYHIGIKGSVSRNTLANANKVRNWQIYADFAQHLIRKARLLYRNDQNGLDIPDTVYALDSSTIDLCLNLFPVPFPKNKISNKTTHCLTYVAISLPSFTFPMANSTM